ncbi:MAG: GNAT family N-acetyltransferase [Pyrinomonadaceae bacterium]
MLDTLGFPLPIYGPVATLRAANRADPDLILPIQAERALAESGVDLRTVDPAGFYARCERRVARGRTWAVIEQGRLLFKAEMQAVTPEAIYLEGIYAHPDVRGRGFGVRCLSHLCRKLLRRTDTLCLLVNEQNHAAQQLYRRVGFRAQGNYDTIFLSNHC